jgi:hypothetical protein
LALHWSAPALVLAESFFNPSLTRGWRSPDPRVDPKKTPQKTQPRAPGREAPRRVLAEKRRYPVVHALLRDVRLGPLPFRGPKPGPKSTATLITSLREANAGCSKADLRPRRPESRSEGEDESHGSRCGARPASPVARPAVWDRGPNPRPHKSRRIRTGTVSDSIPRLLRSLRCLLFRKQKETEQTEGKQRNSVSTSGLNQPRPLMSSESWRA